MGKPRGFAAMDPARVREIASSGGKASQESGTGHRFTTETGKVAGRKGGLTRANRAAERAAERAEPPTGDAA